MNVKHYVDMRRPFAVAYMNNRTSVAFWSGLAEQTKAAIQLYFQDSTMSMLEVAETCNTDASSLRKVMLRRGIYAAQFTRRNPRAEKGEVIVEARKGPVVDNAEIIAPLKARQDAIGVQLRALSQQWDNIQTAINALS